MTVEVSEAFCPAVPKGRAMAGTSVTRLRLSVPEMDCPTCAGKVDRALERVDGVIEAELRPTTGGVDVEYDPDVVTPAAIERAIERAGYSVEARSEDGPVRSRRPPVWRTRRAGVTAIGAAVVAIGAAISLGFVGSNAELVTRAWWSLTTSGVAYLLATAVAGIPILREGAYSLRQRNLDIDLLMSIAIVAAVAAALPFEAAMLAVLYSIAELLERYSMDRARSSIHELIELSPAEATLLADGTERTVPVEAIDVGDTVAVRPGERIPVDGTVAAGTSAVDESPITGESVPAEVEPGDEVFAGTINESGYLEVTADTTASDSTLARIIELVEDAEASRTDYERFVDRFAAAYTPVIVGLALLAAVGPPLAFSAPWRTWFLRGLTLLVIACPCAFVISTPVSVVSGITSAARNGLLIKGGRHLEALADVQVFAIDKTGTLTTGELAVSALHPLRVEADRLVAIAAGLERQSEHPIAEAIMAHATEEGITPAPATDFEALPGRGVAAEVAGERRFAGRPDLFEEIGVDLGVRYRPDGGVCAIEGPTCPHDDCRDLAGDIIPDLEAAGMSVILVGTPDRIEGVIGVADTVRPEARGAIEELHERGVDEVIMLTGDNEGTARTIAEAVGIETYYAGLLPQEKLDRVRALEREHGAVAMVGDGINDAPALAAASVGIAMGAAGTAAAVEAADVALMGDDLGGLPYLARLARSTDGVIRQNIYASLAVKGVLALGAPLGLVTVVHAVVIGDMGMSLGVTGNAMRLSRLRPRLRDER